MTEAERNFYLAELTAKTKLLVQMKLDRRSGKYVSHARMARTAAAIRYLQDTLYPPIDGKENKPAKEVTACQN